MSEKISVAILGATGYVGLELVKILSKHPNVDIVFLGTEKSPNISIQKLEEFHIKNGESVESAKILSKYLIFNIGAIGQMSFFTFKRPFFSTYFF